jgi:hypothetical protein
LNFPKTDLLHELENTAKTWGHRVSKMSPQTLILPKFKTHIGDIQAQKSTFSDLNRFGLNRFAVVLRKVCL